MNWMRMKLLEHVGHHVVCVTYGRDDYIADVCIECEDCGCVLVSAEDFEPEETDVPAKDYASVQEEERGLDMKATGIIRRIDDLGRLVVPKEIRRRLQIHEGDPMELYVDNNRVIFQKYQPSCGVQESLKSFRSLVEDETDLKCRSELLTKISEMQAILKAEEDGYAQQSV